MISYTAYHTYIIPYIHFTKTIDNVFKIVYDKNVEVPYIFIPNVYQNVYQKRREHYANQNQ